MAKLEDQGKKTALAAAAGFDPSLIPFLSKGADGIRALRKEVEASSKAQEEAARAAGPVDDAWKQFRATVDGLKASLVTNLGPAFRKLTEKASAFLTANQAQIGAWIRDFGEKLPARLERLGVVLKAVWTDGIKPVLNGIGWVVDKLGGAENAVRVLIGAWVAFKALQIAGHLGEIGGGLFQMGKGIGAIARALRGGAAAKAAAGAAGAGAQLSLPGLGAAAGGAAAGGAGLAGTLGASVGTLGAGTLAAGVSARHRISKAHKKTGD